jgi:tRNA uridine 5-carboxymethylaminomethyl modification enzyme
MHTAELDVKYEGYIDRQNRQIKRFEKLEWLKIPRGFSFRGVEGLSNESIEKLERVRPVSVGQASRISGVRSSDIALLMIALGK